MTTDYLLGQPLDLPQGTHLLANRDLIEDQWNIEWQLGRPEVVDRATTRPYPGFEREQCLPIVFDAVAEPVPWQGVDIATIAGKPVMLRFILEPGARLYAMRLGNAGGLEWPRTCSAFWLMSSHGSRPRWRQGEALNSTL